MLTQTVWLAAAVAWILLCTAAFRGSLRRRPPGRRPVPPTEQQCSGLLRRWCEARVAAARAEDVRKGMQHAWAGYRAYAWGADELHPKNKSAKAGVLGGVRMLAVLDG